MNCIILSPKKETREAIEQVIKQNKLLKIVKSASYIGDVKDILHHQKIDVAFIELINTGVNGYGMLDELPEGKPFKIFVSAKKELAADAYNYDDSYFVSLPLNPFNLMNALGKVAGANKNVMLSSVSHNNIFVKADNVLVRLQLKDITYIEARADYVTIHTPARRWTVHTTMKGILSKLPKEDFVQVHKSYIVRFDHILRIEGKKIKMDNASIPISNSFKKALMDKLNFLR